MKTKKKVLIIIISVLSLVISFTGGFFTHYFSQGQTLRLVEEITNIIENNAKSPYGEDKEFSSVLIAKKLVEGVLDNDDYAVYYSEQEYEKIKKRNVGNYEGLGFSPYLDLPYVYSVVGNSPADRAGLKKEDNIISVSVNGGEPVLTSKTSDLENEIKDITSNDQVVFLVERDGEKNPLQLQMKKENFVASYVTYIDSEKGIKFWSFDGTNPEMTYFSEYKNESLPLDTAHILLTSFEGGASEQLGQVLDYAYSHGRQKIILDLRGNGGGMMSVLEKVASYFINNGGNKNNLITKGEERKGSSSFYTDGNNFNSNLKEVVVIADQRTASASECLIGAMLCYGDAGFSYDNLLITKNANRNNFSTYGKGIMQTTFPLVSGGALKLTTARIYWPDLTTCIQGVGIEQKNSANQVSDTNAIERAVEILSAS